MTNAIKKKKKRTFSSSNCFVQIVLNAESSTSSPDGNQVDGLPPASSVTHFSFFFCFESFKINRKHEFSFLGRNHIVLRPRRTPMTEQWFPKCDKNIFTKNVRNNKNDK